jgi:hypothetical protein
MEMLKSWILPILVSVSLVLILHPLINQVIAQEDSLREALVNGEVKVGTEVGNNGFMQIYYDIEGNKAYISNTNYSNSDPIIDGEYITWIGQSTGGAWQVFLYNILTKTTIQLSSSSNNTNPKISDGKIVWEGWVSGVLSAQSGWQIFFFDGKSVRQLTSGDLSMNPEIAGDFISYGRQDITGTWRGVVYSISRGKAKDITTGLASQKPIIKKGKIILRGDGEEEFPLTAEDLFLLDLPPLTTEAENEPEVVTEEEIIEELEATPSAVIEEVTSSADSKEE